jgi:hypothetical protein
VSVAAEFTAPGEEHEVVGAVPVLDDVEAVVDFPPQSLVVQIAAQEDGLDGLAELGQGFGSRTTSLKVCSPATGKTTSRTVPSGWASEALAISKQRPVARVRVRGGKQPGELFEGQETDRVGRRAGHGPSLRRPMTAQNNCSGQFCWPSPRRSQAKSAPRWPQVLTVMSSLAGNALREASQARPDASNGGW